MNHPSLTRFNSTGTHSSTAYRNRRESDASYASVSRAPSPASTTLTAPDIDLLKEIGVLCKQKGHDDVVGVTIFRKRPAEQHEATSRSKFYGTGACLHCEAPRAYEANMCKHLAECPAVRSHLDYQANGFNAAENSSLRPRRHTEAQVQRRRLAPQPQPPVIPNLVTQMPRYSQQLSPDDARQMWQAQSWMDIGNIRNARSAPVSHVDPMESRQGSNMPFSQALVDGGDQDMMETTPFGTSNNTVVPHNDDFPAYSYDALNQGQTPASLFGQIHPGINDPTDPSIDLDALMREMQQPPPPEDFYY